MASIAALVEAPAIKHLATEEAYAQGERLTAAARRRRWSRNLAQSPRRR